MWITQMRPIDKAKEDERRTVQENLISTDSREIITYDDVLKQIGSFGKFQSFWFVVLTIIYGLSSIMVYDWVFLMAIPEYQCIDNERRNISVEDQCFVRNSTEPCHNFNYSTEFYDNSLVIRWNMVCDRLWVRNIIQTCLFIGLMFGSLVGGVVADKSGRRFSTRFGTVWSVTFWVFTALTPLLDNYWSTRSVIIIYCFFKFCLGFGQFFLITVIYLYVSEMVGIKHRPRANIILTAFWAIGEIIFVMFAYFIRHPVKLNGSLVVTFIPFLLPLIFLPESVRWLLVEHRFDEAYEIVKKKIRWNKGSTFQLKNWDELVSCERRKLELEHLDREENTSIIITSIKELLRSKIMIRIVFSCWNLLFSGVLIYFGYSFSTDKLPGNPYRNYFLSAVLELCGVVITMFATIKYEKRPIVVTLFFTSGIINIILAIQTIIPLGQFKHISDIVVILLSLTGKMAVAGICAIGFFLSAELFPTSIRGICFGTCSLASRIGSFFAPQILFLSHKYHPSICYIIFSVFAIFAALTTSRLPRTANLPMAQTVAEAEQLYQSRRRRKLSNAP
ncbi:hypothetical protein SNEBB_003040 [Seison nebaliae]|nr:hypothetical protein SNEBB_003040 [Seison nebaliae]